ncbi:hypothetical protein OG218_01185 [Kineococcus sp. NBC_00420]|uniref:hypothetical protein n=1 Tax=Kineococcus sp. NBC_00420 TaxID=2903564 RepID=UPI002E1A18CB
MAATSIGTDVPPELVGTAAGVVNTAAQLGTAVGVAGLVGLSLAVTGATGNAVAGTAWAWVGAAVLALGTVVYLASARGGRVKP